MFAFIAVLFVGINYSTHLEEGLDQRVALPRGSYLINYFDQLDKYLAVGPPLYIVFRGEYDYTTVEDQDKLCSNPGW